MYDVYRFRSENILVEFSSIEDFHDLFRDLMDTGGVGCDIDVGMFDIGFTDYGCRRCFWSKECNRLFWTAIVCLLDYHVVQSYELLMEDCAIAPSKTDVVNFLIGGDSDVRH